MNLNWSNRVIKYVLFVFNLLFVISGIIVIAVGVSVKAYYTDYDIFLNDSYFSLPNLLIAIGSLIFFISFFGCCGAIRESWFMIFVFSVLLSIIFIMEFSAGIAGYVLRDKTVSYLEEELHNAMKLYQFNINNNSNSETHMWDIIQSKFECCGVEGPQDWPPSHFPSPTTTSVTSSKSSSLPTKPATNTTKEPTSTTTKSTATSIASTSSTTLPPTTDPNGSNGTSLGKRAAESIDSSVSARDTYYDLPLSCCKANYGATNAFCNLKDQSTATYFKIGCVEGFGDFLKEHAVTLGGVGIAIAFIQLFGVIFACHLTKQLRRGFHST